MPYRTIGDEMADTKPVIVGVDDADDQDTLVRYAAHQA